MNYLVGSPAYAQNRANSVLIVLNELGVSLCRVLFGESNKNIYMGKTKNWGNFVASKMAVR